MIERMCVHYFKKEGWRFLGVIPKRERAVVLVYGPQKSWRELVLAIAVKALTHFKVTLMVEKSAWNWKSRWLLNAAGAEAFDPDNIAELKTRGAEQLNAQGNSAVAFPMNPVNQPSGKKYTHIYEISQGEDTLVVLVAFDFRRKVIKFHSPFRLSGYPHRDMDYINGFFSTYYWQVTPLVTA